MFNYVRENVSLQSTCNTIGQASGMFVSFNVFIILESQNFSNKYIRSFLGLPAQSGGILTMRSFMYFFAGVYFLTTLVVLILKRETTEMSDEELREELAKRKYLGEVVDESAPIDRQIQTPELWSTYKLIWKIFKIPSVKLLAIILLTLPIGFEIESVQSLKLIEYGVPKETLTLYGVPLTLVNLLLAVYLSKHITGHRPFIIMRNVYPIK